MARDSYSYLHFPMVAGIVLLALGLKKTLAHVEDPLHVVPAFALLGGLAFYLLAHVAFRLPQRAHAQLRGASRSPSCCSRSFPAALELPRAGASSRSSTR